MSEHSINRRDVLKKGFALAAIPFLRPGNTEAKQSTDLELASDETIVGLKQDGWNLLYNLDALKTSSETDSKSIILETQGGYNNPQVEIANGTVRSSSSAFYFPGEDYTTGVLEVLPKPPNKIIQIELNDGSESTSKQVEVELEFYTPDSEDSSRIVAEKEPETYSLVDINTSLKKFDAFKKKLAPVYIYSPKKYSADTAGYNTEADFIKVTERFFSQEEFFKSGLLLLEHEAFHSIHPTKSNPQEESFNIELELEDLLKRLWLEATNNELEAEPLGFTDQRVMESPVFGLFDESEYDPNLRELDPRDVGHPWSNIREFFASACNIMSNFPDVLIEKCDKLDSDKRESAHNSIRLLLVLAKTLSVSEEELFKNFPGFKDVKNYWESIENFNSNN